MKKLLFLLLMVAAGTMHGYCQDNAGDTSKPYRKNPTLPAFNIRLMDSVTIFNTYNIPKGRPAILVFFSPDCGHCQAFFKKMLPSMDSLKNLDFYIATQHHSFTDLRKFYDEYGLAKYKNIKVVGRDYEFFGPPFFSFTSVPDLILYDRKKRFVKFFDRGASVADIYKYSKNL